MLTFLSDFWTYVWHSNELADHARGLILVLLSVSLTMAIAGAVADPFLKRAHQPAGEIERSATHTFFKSLCANVPITAGASVIFVLLLGLLGLERKMRWAGAGAAVPALLVLLQYVYLWAHKPAVANDPNSTEGLDSQDERAQMALDSSYGPRTLFIRYGFPAIILLVECLVLAIVLVDSDAFLSLYPEVVHGAKFGAAGAYAWVVIELGRRTFRRDVTSGIALWCVVTLAVGPLLAGTLALVWKPDLKDEDAWQAAAVLFYAGYAPRKVLAAVTSAASKLLDGGPAPTVETRSTPLTKIRGITPQIEERLAEEGVDNVENLATVEPFRLQRDTPYDLRTIIWWIDEAILMRYLPQRWEMLEEKGITGAIDLADLSNSLTPNANANANANANDANANAEKAAAAAEAAALAGKVIDELATHISEKSEALRAIAARIRSDRQVSYIWWIYNRYVTDGQNRKGDTEQPALPGPSNSNQQGTESGGAGN